MTGVAAQAFDVVRRGRARLDARTLNLVCFGAFLVLLVILISIYGLMISRDTVFLVMLAGLLAISAADLKGWARGVIIDWLPFFAALFVYDLLRGYAGNNPLYDPHVLPQIRVDEWLFNSVPTVWLQERLFDAGTVHWYDLLAWGTYLTHFFLGFVIAAVLWRTARPRFLEFRAMWLTLTFAAFLTYLFVPAAPPWMASDNGVIGPVSRIVGDVWGSVGIQPAQMLWEPGSSLSNQVAALPSLHTAYPVLIMCFFWPSGLRARLICVPYAIAMSLTLVYTGEHYVADVLLGWIYAIATYFAVSRIRAWLARRRGDAPPEGEPAPALALETRSSAAN